jgi:hypothetical protein
MTPLYDDQAAVATWMFAKAGCKPMQFNLAVGLVDAAGELRGGIMFTTWNGSDAELHFYGPGCLTRRTVRLAMQIAAEVLRVNRLTVRTRKPSMARGVLKLGAVEEGTVKRLYGPTDEARHAGRQFAFFRETILKLARMEA